MYTSTRKKLNIDASEAIIRGISEEGGLFIFHHIKPFLFNKNFSLLSYQEMAEKILTFYLNDFTNEEIKQVIAKTYTAVNFKNKIIGMKNLKEFSFLELYHGPTLSFKDMALTMLPNLIEVAKVKQNDCLETLILTATSGDTGGAALASFGKTDNNKIIVLYPIDGVSYFQERQMHFYTNQKARLIGIKGNFDDCQNIVKTVFTSMNNLRNIKLSSANSINIGRLLPQIIYYFYAYFKMVNQNEILYGESINVVVPTGNFGNILACYIAKKMGLFINKIICASNENNILTDFFNTKIYNCNRPFYLTNSPAMDILISSNLERLLFIITDGNYKLVDKLMKDLKEKNSFYLPKQYHSHIDDFLAYSICNTETLFYIKDCFEKYNYLIDPHTAVAYGAYLNLKNKLKGKTLIISTASPFKFIDTVNEVFKIEEKDFTLAEKIAEKSGNKIPDVLKEIYEGTFQQEVWCKEDACEKLKKLIGELDENC